MVAAKTLSDFFFSTGMDSPVTGASSILERPSIIRPSVAIASPGLTMNTSPIARLSAGTVTSFPSFMTRASLGARSRSSLIECLAFA